ncbi:MAG: hypothetical protein IPO92_17860 [Saprospiraceae bacterium]|nr:hypothetical protein [Saprospiraceae bacterium]
MFIIVESGSTKADWVIVRDSKNFQFFKTEGINPATQVDLLDLTDRVELLEHIRSAEKIYFYGAGIIDAVSSNRIKAWLDSFGFTGDLTIKEDLLAAARSCFGNEAGIACILGTGSNSCVYDGKHILKSIPTLGYILSDEGGGTKIGQEILKSFFYGTMPDKEKNIFIANYPVTKEILVERLYRSSGGNSYLASFAKFLTEIDGVWKERLLKNVFREFVDLRIALYPGYESLNIKFVGSIAHYHRVCLNEVLSEYGLKAVEIIQQPIYKLIEYHIKNKINE